MGTASVWLVSLVLCWGLPSPHTTLSNAAVYYVTPHTPNPDCPTSGEPCLTLNEYAQEDHFDGDDNIALLFMNGEHNLTAQNLEIADKISLVMAPVEKLDKVVIQLFSGIIAQNILNIKLTELEFISQSADQANCTSNCLSISDIGLLSVIRVAINYCEFSLSGNINATITELTTSRSCIYSGSTMSNQTVTINTSELYFSIINIGKNLSSQAIIGDDIIANTLIIESTSMKNSLVKLQTQYLMVYFLWILNCEISSNCNNCSSEFKTGIMIESCETATIHAHIENCSVVGNYQGINTIVRASSHVELIVNRCFIENNSYISEPSGGVVLFQSDQSNAVTNTTVTSSTLSGNKLAQIRVLGYSGKAMVTVFNSTIRNTYFINFRSAGAYFQNGVGYGCSNMIINITQNLFENNIAGIKLCEGNISLDNIPRLGWEKNCKHDFFFNGNIVTMNNVLKLEIEGGLEITTVSSMGGVNIVNSIFTHNQGSAMLFDTNSLLITINKTIIKQNENGILVEGIWSKLRTNMVIKDTVFQENEGISLGVVITGVHDDALSYKRTDITLKNVIFVNNTNQGHILNPGIIQVDGTVTLNIEDCVFRANHGSSIKALATLVILSGITIFEDNFAIQGGAISLSYSMLRFRSVNKTNTNIMFVNNTAAIAGGGIHVDYSSMNVDKYTGSYCFYDYILGIPFEIFINSTVNITLVFINNTATNGGNDIYGATPNSHCLITFRKLNFLTAYYSVILYKQIFKTSSNLSSISSDPKRVCLCDSSSQLMCANLSYILHNTTRYPGEVFSLFLAVVGFEFGTVSGPVYADLLPQANNSMSFLGSGQHAREFGSNGCTEFNFTVNTNNTEEIVILTTSTNQIIKPSDFNKISSALHSYNENKNHPIPYALLTVPVYIRITLQNCPPGFVLTKSGGCNCIPALRAIGINYCSIHSNTPYITRSGNQWIKPAFNQNGILYSKLCPFNYCVHKTMSLNLNNPDQQCVLNRTGVLCGSCPSNLSLAIGSSKCLVCSDNYHTLQLIAFAGAGLLLVLFIKILDVTVTTGAINGLVFYANIIWANQALLFPSQTQPDFTLQFLKTFIAWLNLDLGIETCFIQHLDGYWKTWLQFVFPFYIWLIAGLIILISHFSIKATKILGNNSLSVLATLFLLSYAKLLRSILTVFGFTLLETPGGQIGVWSFDGNLSYFSLKHSILFAVAIVLLLLLWLPYTLSLLFIQCLRKCSHHRFLRWVNKLTPLFDSYLGPLKVKYHYWIGLGLLTRLVLLLTSAIALTTIPFIAVVMISLAAFVLGLLVLGVYKQWELSLFEGCYLFNMAMFSSGVLFIEAQGGSKDTLTHTSLGIAFVLFLAIIVYHVWRRLKSLRMCTRRPNGYEKINNIITPPPAQDPLVQQPTTC